MAATSPYHTLGDKTFRLRAYMIDHGVPGDPAPIYLSRRVASLPTILGHRTLQRCCFPGNI